jgi:DNA-binding PadR family transcriptional regulator
VPAVATPDGKTPWVDEMTGAAKRRWAAKNNRWTSYVNIKHPDDSLPLTPQAFCILSALVAHPTYGQGIYEQCVIDAGDSLEFDRGSVYRTLRNLTDNHLVTVSEPTIGPGAYHQRRYYQITPIGLQILEWETNRYLEAAALAKDRIKLLRQHVQPKPLPPLPSMSHRVYDASHGRNAQQTGA